MKIAIIGYNIFWPGGTTRNNINLLNSFVKMPLFTEIGYFNFIEFDSQNVVEFTSINDELNKVTYHHLGNYNDLKKYDSIILTRESLFYVAKIAKSLKPKIRVVAEVHAPLSMINESTKFYEEYVDIYKVATKSVKDNIYHNFSIRLDQIVVNPVSIDHLDFNNHIVNSQPTNNLFIHSRFDEKQKNITRTIQIMHILINQNNAKNIKLYIKGSGPDEKKYRQLIQLYKLKDNVFIGKDLDIPNDAAYISTANVESFGYSLIEALNDGRRVILSPGTDNVCFENFGTLKSLFWLSFDDTIAADQILSAISSPYVADLSGDIEILKQLCSFNNYGETYYSRVLNKDNINSPVDIDANFEKSMLLKEIKCNSSSFLRRCFKKLIR